MKLSLLAICLLIAAATLSDCAAGLHCCTMLIEELWCPSEPKSMITNPVPSWPVLLLLLLWEQPPAAAAALTH